MKKILYTIAIALVGAALLQTTQAAPVAASYGDIILGFESTGGNSSGGTVNYLLDLGAYSNLGSFSTINIGSDLTSVFGSGWTNSISYGAYGTTYVVHWTQNYLTEPGSQAAFGLLTLGNTTSKTDTIALVDLYNLQLGNGVTNTYGINSSSTATGAWSTYTPGTSPFGVSADHNIEAAVGNSLNLINRSYSPHVNTTTPYTILVDTAGNLSVSAVPEPSSYVLLGLGALGLMILYRRQTNA